MQNIFGSTFGILTVTSHPQALEFPVIIISWLQQVLVCIVLKHTVRYTIGWISLFPWERALPYAVILLWHWWHHGT
jgi:hypothetical protein